MTGIAPTTIPLAAAGSVPPDGMLSGMPALLVALLEGESELASARADRSEFDRLVEEELLGLETESGWVPAAGPSPEAVIPILRDIRAQTTVFGEAGEPPRKDAMPEPDGAAHLATEVRSPAGGPHAAPGIAAPALAARAQVLFQLLSGDARHELADRGWPAERTSPPAGMPETRLVTGEAFALADLSSRPLAPGAALASESAWMSPAAAPPVEVSAGLAPPAAAGRAAAPEATVPAPVPGSSLPALEAAESPPAVSAAEPDRAQVPEQAKALPPPAMLDGPAAALPAAPVTSAPTRPSREQELMRMFLKPVAAGAREVDVVGPQPLGRLPVEETGAGTKQEHARVPEPAFTLRVVPRNGEHAVETHSPQGQREAAIAASSPPVRWETARQEPPALSGRLEPAGEALAATAVGEKTERGARELPEREAVPVEFRRETSRQEHSRPLDQPRAEAQPLRLSPAGGPNSRLVVDVSRGSEPLGGIPGDGRCEPARVVDLRVTGDNAETVAVRVRQRSGELQVTVRAPDETLASSLRRGLPELVNRLEQRGFEAQVWRPAAAGVAESAGAREPGSADRGGAGGFGDGPGQQWSQGEGQGEGRRHLSQDRRAWAEATEAFIRESRTGGREFDEHSN